MNNHYLKYGYGCAGENPCRHGINLKEHEVDAKEAVGEDGKLYVINDSNNSSTSSS